MSVPYFLCDNCQTRYQHDAGLVGQAIRCKMCGYVFRVPSEALVDLAEKPRGTGRWFLRFPNGRQFGPVVRDVVAEWIHEGRATGESWVIEEGTQDWKQVQDAFPDLVKQITEAPVDPYAPEPLSVTRIPAAGLLDYWPDEFEFLSHREQEQHHQVTEWLQAECQRTMGVVRLRGRRSVRIGEKVVFGESTRMPEEARPESLTVFALGNQNNEFYLVVPWSKLGRLAHEFVSIIPGRLPSSIALRRRGEDSFGGGQWVGISGTENDILAVAAKRTQDDLAKDIRWQWFSEGGDFTMILVWGLQAVPLGDEKFLHMMQTATMGPQHRDFGLLWYLERQSAFYRFSRRLSIPHDHETHFLFSTSSGQLFASLSTLPDNSGTIQNA
jgi:predicted Zn finger-like uncharacterized protein